MIVRELVTKLAFDSDEKAVKSFDNAVAGLTKGLTLAVGAATAVSAALFGLAKSTAAAGDAAAKLGRQIGLTAEEVQELQYAEQQAGAEGFTASLGMLNSRLAEAARGSGRAKTALEEYGIAATDAEGRARTVSDILPEIADRMAGLSEAEQADIARALGITPRSILLLGGGSEALEEARQRFRDLGGQISNQSAAISEVFNDSLHDLQVISRGLMNVVGERLIPIVVEVTHAFRDWFIENREIIRQNIGRFIEALIAGLRVFWNTVRGIIRIVNDAAQALGGWDRTLRLIGAALAVIVAQRILAGFLLLAGGIARVSSLLPALLVGLRALARVIPLIAFAALLEDMWVWARGGDSVIQHFLGTWEEFTGAIRDMFATLFRGDLVGFLHEFGEFMYGLFERQLNLILGLFGSSVAKIRGMFGEMFGWVRDGLMNMIPDWMINLFPSSVTSPVSTTGADVAGQIMGSSGAVSNVNVNDNRQVTIEVPPGTNQEQIDFIRQEFNRSMQQQLNDAALNLETR